MADDIVARLRDIGYELSDDYSPTVFEAADEIERLRAAGDVIAGVLAARVGDQEDVQRLLNTWEEARRG